MTDGTYWKQDPIPDRLDVAVRKQIAGFELSDSELVFRTPEILEVTADGVRMEELTSITPMRRFLPGLATDAMADVLFRVGTALAMIHTGLRVPGAHATMLWAGSREPVTPIHGDFGLWNVQFDTDRGVVAILDWSTPAWLKKWYSHGPPAWDLALFTVDLMYMWPLEENYVKHASTGLAAFLSGYRSIRPLPRDLSSMLRHVAVLYLRSPATDGTMRALRIPSLARILMTGAP